jgi:hypothetical protein
MMAVTKNSIRAAFGAALASGSLLIGAVSGTVAHAYTNPNTLPATGSFTLNTAPGIVPAWEREDIVLTAISPATATDLSVTATTKLTMPVVAKTGSAVALSGGFRLTNTQTRETIRCMIPTVDTKALVLDCIVNVDENLQIFAIDAIKSRSSEVGLDSRTTQFTGMAFKVASIATADQLNKALSTSVFTSSVVIATGDLTVTWGSTTQS